MAKKITILYISIDPFLGGSTASLFNMVECIRDFINPIVLFPEEGVGFDYFTQNGIESYVYPFVCLHRYKANRIKDVWTRPWRWHYIKKLRSDYECYFFVKKILAGRHIDIVHTNASPIDIGVLLARKFHAIHIWHVREFCDLDFHYNIYGGIPRLRNLINNADARIAISSAIKMHWLMGNNNTWMINNAIRKKTEACINVEKKKYLLFTSYFLTESKGTRNAIVAFAKSGIKEEGYRLCLIGNCSDEYMQSLLATLDQYCISEAVEFIPCQTNIKPYFTHASAYIMASECEALGRVTAEAMFYGCPVIAHATGGTLDLVKDKETGYLYNTIDECATLIRDVCSKPQDELILRAHDFAVNNLSQEVYGPKIMEVYNKMLQ